MRLSDGIADEKAIELRAFNLFERLCCGSGVLDDGRDAGLLQRMARPRSDSHRCRRARKREVMAVDRSFSSRSSPISSLCSSLERKRRIRSPRQCNIPPPRSCR